MPPVPQSQIHVDVPLTNVSLAYQQDARNFVASRVFPVIPVQRQSDLFYIYPRDAFNRPAMKKRAPGTESAGAGWEMTRSSYYCERWGLHTDITPEDRANADPMINLDVDATEFLTAQGLLTKEIEWANKYFVTGVWTGEWEGVASSPSTNEILQWNDANSDPIKNVADASTAMQLRTGFRPNCLVLSRPAYDALKNHPDFLDRVKFGGANDKPALVTLIALAALFEVPEVLVMDGIVNTAKEGQAESNAFIAGKHALLVYREMKPSLKKPSAGYTFAWAGLLPGVGAGTRIKNFSLEPRVEADRIEIDMAFSNELVAADLGHFLRNVVA